MNAVLPRRPDKGAKNFAAGELLPLTEQGQEQDRVRDELLAKQGFRVVRVAGYDVLREPEMTRQRVEEM
jgi:hypothetical protein